MNAPEVSVVMSVYNGAESLRETLQSVLGQADVGFEFIAVDDGSTDGSGGILREFAQRDSRLKVITQENRGLTRALIRGCAEAQGEFIARQDAGDLSLPGRLKAQVEALAGHPEAVLVSCGTRFTGPRGEPLHEVSSVAGDATSGLLTLDPQGLRGPSHHGSTLFRRDAYERAGGYREQFYFAQDLDLWVRLAEHGKHLVFPAVLYQASFVPDTISGRYRSRQIASARIILECARLRRAGLSEAGALERARGIVPERGRASSSDRARALYFIGMCLRQRNDSRASHYFRQALRVWPIHVKSALRLLFS